MRQSAGTRGAAEKHELCEHRRKKQTKAIQIGVHSDFRSNLIFSWSRQDIDSIDRYHVSLRLIEIDKFRGKGQSVNLDLVLCEGKGCEGKVVNSVHLNPFLGKEKLSICRSRSLLAHGQGVNPSISISSLGRDKLGKLAFSLLHCDLADDVQTTST